MTSVADKLAENAAQPASQTPKSRHPLAGLRAEIDRLFDFEPLRRCKSAFTGAVPTAEALIEPTPPTALHRRRRPFSLSCPGSWPGKSGFTRNRGHAGRELHMRKDRGIPLIVSGLTMLVWSCR